MSETAVARTVPLDDAGSIGLLEEEDINTSDPSLTQNSSIRLDELDDLDDEKMDELSEKDNESEDSEDLPIEEEAFFGGFSAEQRSKYPSLFGDYPDMGFHNVFYACQNNPLGIWDKQIRNGSIKRIVDDDGTACLKLTDTGRFKESQTNTYITAPCAPFGSLGIKLPYIQMSVKNVHSVFSFRVMVRDSKDSHRSLTFSTKVTMLKKLSTNEVQLPLRLEFGWNQLSFDLDTYIFGIYQTYTKEVVRLQIFPNCRLRMINFVSTPINIHHELAILREIMNERERMNMMDPPFDKRFDGYEPFFVATKVLVPDNLLNYVSKQSIRRQADALQMKPKERAPLSQPKRVFTRPTPALPWHPQRVGRPVRGVSSTRLFRTPYVSWREIYAKKSTELIRSQSRADLLKKLNRITDAAVEESIKIAERKQKREEISLKRKRGEDLSESEANISIGTETNSSITSSVDTSASDTNPVIHGATGGKPKAVKARHVGSQTHLADENTEDTPRTTAIRFDLSGHSKPASTMSAFDIRTDPLESSQTLVTKNSSNKAPVHENTNSIGSSGASSQITLKASEPSVTRNSKPTKPNSERHSDSRLSSTSKSIMATPQLRAEFIREAERLSKSSLTTDQVTAKLKAKHSALKALDVKAQALEPKAEASGGNQNEPEVETLVRSSKHIQWGNQVPSNTNQSKSIPKNRVVLKGQTPKKRVAAMTPNVGVKPKLQGTTCDEETKENFTPFLGPAVAIKTKTILKRPEEPMINTLMEEIRLASSVVRNSEASRTEAKQELSRIKTLMKERVRLLDEATDHVVTRGVDLSKTDASEVLEVDLSKTEAAEVLDEVNQNAPLPKSRKRNKPGKSNGTTGFDIDN